MVGIWLSDWWAVGDWLAHGWYVVSKWLAGGWYVVGEQ